MQTSVSSPQNRPNFSNSATELLQSTSKSLIIGTGSVFLVWQFIFIVSQLPYMVGPVITVITPILFLSGLLSFLIVDKHPRGSQALWQVGLALAITFSSFFLKEPLIVFFYAFLPLSAVIATGLTGGILSEILVIGLVYFIRAKGGVNLSQIQAMTIITSGVFTGVIGWIMSNSFLIIAQWSLFYVRQTHEKFREMGEKQVEMEEIKEDLLLANRELARVSDRLKAMYQVAEDARRAKEQFVANVSHELRTPLNMIIGFSEMISQSPRLYGAALPPALMADIFAIRRNAQHLTRLINDVLDLSQLDAGRVALIKERVSIGEIVQSAAQAVKALFKTKNLTLEIVIDPSLPDLFCDGTRIQQVILNLLSNAGRYTEQGGVQVKAWRERNEVIVSVTDTGPGISAENQKLLFQPFQQLDNSIRRKHGGSGLGLSISKRFVEMHEGRMLLTSSPGKGTTIYFSLPIDPPVPVMLDLDARRWFNPNEEMEYKIRTRPFKAPVQKITPRFVVCEEETTLQRMISRYINNVEVISVESLEEALRVVNQSPSQALIINTHTILENTSPLAQTANLPIGTPAITCWVPGEKEAARRLGVVRYLVKPISHETLLSTVEKFGEKVKTVLIVDDEREILQLFTRMLTSSERGYRILQASDGQRAIDLMRERKPDLVLLDLIMPEMDGFQVLREKSQDPTIRDIPVITITSIDPGDEPLVSGALSVNRNGGLSSYELLDCIKLLSEILSPTVRPDDPAQPGNQAA